MRTSTRGTVRAASPPLDFRVLGPLEVGHAGRALQLGGRKQRSLIALLLIHAGEVVSVDRLVDELWGESPPRTATTSLHNFVAQLRKVLPADVLVTQPPGYVLRIERERLDAARFERLVHDARAEEPGRRSELLREALGLWRGPPLADFTYEAFAKNEIHRLEELRLDALEARIDADLELGEGSELVAELEALVAQCPLRERLRRQLMLALYRAGRQAEALQAYHDARHVLVEELGIEPGPELSRLYRSILRQESPLVQASSPTHSDDHIGDVTKALLTGRLVLVLGSGANPEGELPTVEDVTSHLARVFECPESSRDLARIAEYVTVTKGAGPLYDELHTLYARDAKPGSVHAALVQLAAAAKARGAPGQLVLTTNFDRLLERAFRDAGEELDAVVYLALGRHRGKFLHLRADGGAAVVEVPNAYTDLSLDRTNVLFKIHGGIDPRPDREWESFVVSEDDYIDYLAQTDISVALPVTLAARLRRSHFLFLGYPLDGWNLRVFLHRLFGREKVAYRSWAVGPQAGQIEHELWRQRGIDVFDFPVDEYLDRLCKRVAGEEAL